MMRKNRILALGLSLVMCAAALAGCGKGTANDASSTSNQKASGDKYSIVCTTFPQYDWIREIIGDQSENFEMTLLLDNGVDLHSYQPTAEDISKIASADMFVYVGGESDGWVDDALANAANKDMKVVNMLESLGNSVKEEELVEGMEGEEEEEGEEVEEEGPEYDEHVWLSVKNAMTLTKTLSETVQEIDAAHAAKYVANADSYVAKLSELDSKYKEATNTASTKTVLFGDRFPFRYLVDDYGLDYYAAFVGCSAETEASFETITYLAGKVDELGLNAILVIENSDQKIAETIKQNTKSKDKEILAMNSLQSITSEDAKGGTTYLKVMEDNLEVLKKAIK